MYMEYEFFNKVFNSAFRQAKHNKTEHAIAIRRIQDYANFHIFKRAGYEDRFEALLTEEDLQHLDVSILQVAFNLLGYVEGFFVAIENDKFTAKQIKDAFDTLSFILDWNRYYFELEKEVLITDLDVAHELALKMNR